MKDDVQSKIVVYRTVVRPPAQIIRTVVGYYRCRKTDDRLPTKNTVVASYERTVNNDMNSGCLGRAYRGFQCTRVGRRGSMHRISLWNSPIDFHGEIPWGYLQEPARTNCLPYCSQYCGERFTTIFSVGHFFFIKQSSLSLFIEHHPSSLQTPHTVCMYYFSFFLHNIWTSDVYRVLDIVYCVCSR
jgi:hypothetical protein